MGLFSKKWKCGVCGASQPARDKFCPKCGTPKQIYRDRYDVFVSYRRDGGGDVAAVVQLELEKFGKSVFLDVLELQVGRFDEQILKVIELSQAFVLILSPGCLDRCVNKSDWLKREIMHALTLGKRIIPVHLSGFSFPNETGLALLPAEMGVLPNLQSVEWDSAKRDAAVRKIVQAMVAPYKPPGNPTSTDPKIIGDNPETNKGDTIKAPVIFAEPVMDTRWDIHEIYACGYAEPVPRKQETDLPKIVVPVPMIVGENLPVGLEIGSATISVTQRQEGKIEDRIRTNQVQGVDIVPEIGAATIAMTQNHIGESEIGARNPQIENPASRPEIGAASLHVVKG